MADQWRLGVQLLPRYGLPVVSARLNGIWEATFLLSPGESSSLMAPGALEAMFLRIGRGRRLLPTAAGVVIANTVQIESIRLSTLDRGYLEIAPYTFAVSNQATTLGVIGVLGADFFSRFSQLGFENANTQRVLTLEL